eukprot:3814552-Alexandrium_andersonii.AAC.1
MAAMIQTSLSQTPNKAARIQTSVANGYRDTDKVAAQTAAMIQTMLCWGARKRATADMWDTRGRA